MTEQELNNAAIKIVDAAKHDKKTKEDYNRYWIKKFLKFVTVPIGYIIVFLILRATDPHKIADWGLLAGLVIDIPLVFIMLSFMKVKASLLSDGRKCFTIIGTIFKLLCAFCSFFPFVYMLYSITYDPRLGTSPYPIWQIILYSPIIFVAMILMGLFMGSSAPYSEKKDKNGNPVMTKSDYRLMRQDQEIAGLDPDKMPFVLSPSEIKNMSRTDWFQLGMELELAGYKVFKKK